MDASYTFRWGENRFHKEAWQMLTFLAILQQAQTPGESFSNQVIATSLPFDLIINLDGVYGAYSDGRILQDIVWKSRPHNRTDDTKARYYDIGPNEIRYSFFISLFSFAFEKYSSWLLGSGPIDVMCSI